VSVRSRAAVLDAPVPVAKVFGPGVPPAITAAEARSHMTPASPFGPGTPVGPYDGFDRTPRATPFTTGYNIATRPRTHERVSFETLKGLIDNYDVSQICINHRIDSLRSLDWKLVAKDGYSGDVTDYISLGAKALDKPDRVHYFETWLGKWLWDELAYGCGPLYRLRNRAGRCVGLLPVDVLSVAPLLDYWGLPPGAMEHGRIPDADLPEAYVQYVNGLPWNWLTRADLIYEPYRLHNDSPYGRAPIESIILSANTDIRFQLYFLQRFTEGNLPAAFASSPETWTPDQIEEFQSYWDSFVYGDQAAKHQIRWLPPGSKFEWSNEKDFTDTFSLFLMRKTAAAYHVVPSDLGFTESVNKSSGESQGDVAHRVGDLPFIRYVQRILTSFLQDDLRLPLKFTFDLGEEQDDRAEQANADKIYVDMGAVGVSELREMRYGLTDPVPVPRYIFTERAGPIPIASLLAVAGEIDPETGLPAQGAPLPEEVFGGTEGVLPNPPIKVMSLAEREFGPKAMPPAPPPQPVLQPGQVGQSEAPVAKEGEGPGITAETGLYSYDLGGRDDDDEDDGGEVRKRYLTVDEVRQAYRDAVAAGKVSPEVVAAVEARMTADREAAETAVAKEMQAFRNFARKRRKAGEWQDFTFRTVPAVRAHNLNDDGRLAVRKDAGEVAVAGLAVLAADTGRVLMLQRALCDDDPAAGTWEFPGGHLEGDESPLAAAWREWQEETGVACAPGVQSGTWASGIYQGIVWAIESESMIPVRGETVIGNPDDPDGDQCESIAWWDPATLAGNPAVRPELAASLPDVLPLLGCEPGEVAKAGGSSSPKVPGVPKSLSAPEDWPGWQRDLELAGIYAGRIREALRDAVDPRQLAEGWARAHPPADVVAKSVPQPVKAFLGTAAGAAIIAALGRVLPSLWAEGWVLGQQSAIASATAAAAATPREASAALAGVDWANWQPGDPEAAYQVAGAGLRDLLADQDVQIKSIASSRLEELGNILAEHLSSPETGGPVTYSVDSLADSLGDVLDDPSRAEMVARTELARASQAAASWVFQAIGVTLVRISTAADARVCQTCLNAESAGAQPIGTFVVPLHPMCRCATVSASPPLTPLTSLAGALGLDGS
jgi:8-oxo-dGTP pyrophosphatase MutT (NUDIX family)